MTGVVLVCSPNCSRESGVSEFHLVRRQSKREKKESGSSRLPDLPVSQCGGNERSLRQAEGKQREVPGSEVNLPEPSVDQQ